MGFLDNIVQKEISGVVTEVNIGKAVSSLMTQIAGIVAGTDNKIDDAVLAELDKDVDFAALAKGTASWLRNLLGVSPEASAVIHINEPRNAGQPHIFLKLMRARAVTELVKANNVSRTEARKMVASKTDAEFLDASDQVGIPRSQIGDGTILQWLITNGPQIIAFIMQILKLFGFVAASPAPTE